MIRARNLRAAANFIPAKSFRARKAYYNNEVRIVSLSVFYYYYYFDKKKKKIFLVCILIFLSVFLKDLKFQLRRYAIH